MLMLKVRCLPSSCAGGESGETRGAGGGGTALSQLQTEDSHCLLWGAGLPSLLADL